MTLSFPSRKGSVVGGYELLDKIGEGGMGAVYRARKPDTDELVAVKMLFPEKTNNSNVGRPIPIAEKGGTPIKEVVG